MSNSQICKLKTNYHNLLQINGDEKYFLFLQDYFIGDGLQYRLKDNQQYFQINPPINQGVIIGEVISIAPQIGKVSQQKDLLILIKVNQVDQVVYEIHNLNNISKKKIVASKFNHRFNFDQCYQMNQINDYIIVTCQDFEQEQIKYLTFDSNYNLIETFSFKMNNFYKESNIMTKSAGKYISTLINYGFIQNDQYISHYSELIILQFEKSLSNDGKKIILSLEIIKQIGYQDDIITGFEIAKEGYLFLSQYSSGIEIHNLNQNKENKISVSIKKAFLGISAQKISYGSYEYNIVCWDDMNLLNFLYDPQDNEIISREKVIQTKQISLTLMFKTNVFINDKYIVLSNFNGISIYPTIINDVNEGRLLFYYPSKPQISYFINIIDYLLTIEEQQLFVYIIKDPLIIQQHLEQTQIPQSFQITAISNEFDKLQVKCPLLTLYYNINYRPQTAKTPQQYFDMSYQIRWTTDPYGIYNGKMEKNKQIQINIDCKETNQVQLNDIFIKSSEKYEFKIKREDMQKVKIDKIETTVRYEKTNFFYNEVFYSKQQLLYQYKEAYEFKEKFYMILQSQFQVELKECLAIDQDICTLLHRQSIEHSNLIQSSVFNIHKGFLYFGFFQNLQWDGFENFEEFTITNSNVEIYRFRLNENVRSVQKYQITHLFHKIIQIDIIDDKLYMLYSYKKQDYLFSSKIEEIKDYMEIHQFSYLVNQCNHFTFNIEHYGYFLYFITTEQDLINNLYVNYLVVINIEGGSFQQISKLSIYTTNEQNMIRTYFIYFTNRGVYTTYKIGSIAFELYFLTKTDFFLLAFTSFKEKSQLLFQKLQINLLLSQDYGPKLKTEFTYSASERNIFCQFRTTNNYVSIMVISLKSTSLNVVKFLSIERQTAFNLRVISLLKWDVFQSKFEAGQDYPLGLKFIKEVPQITINCDMLSKIDDNTVLTIPFSSSKEQGPQRISYQLRPNMNLILVIEKEQQQVNPLDDID